VDAVTLRQYETLSPFEIKNDLAAIATKTSRAAQVAYLNAGRGNPNWIATEPRSGFFLLGQFAITESLRTIDHPDGVGGMPQAPGVALRLAQWLSTHGDMPGATFLQRVIPWGVVEWVKAHVHPLDIVFRLAEDHGIVLLNGGGFEAPDWSVRVSFANLDDDVYRNIGRAVRAAARGYVMAYRAAREATTAPSAGATDRGRAPGRP
jgi:hypothetical protein